MSGTVRPSGSLQFDIAKQMLSDGGKHISRASFRTSVGIEPPVNFHLLNLIIADRFPKDIYAEN